MAALDRWPLHQLRHDGTAHLLSAMAERGLAHWATASGHVVTAMQWGDLGPVALLDAEILLKELRPLNDYRTVLSWRDGVDLAWEGDEPTVWTVPVLLEAPAAFRVRFEFRLAELGFDTPVVMGLAWGDTNRPRSDRPVVALQIHKRSGEGGDAVQLTLLVGPHGREFAMSPLLHQDELGIGRDQVLVAQLEHVPRMRGYWATLRSAYSDEQIVAVRLFDVWHGGVSERVELGLLGIRPRGRSEERVRVRIEKIELRVSPKE